MFCGKALSALKLGSVELAVVERGGRFAEERNFELYLPDGRRLLVVKCFAGRRPYWSRWAEVFAVTPKVEVGGALYEIAGSKLERELLERLAAELRGGDLIYVEYSYDPETSVLLRFGAPPAVTRLGFALLQLGFTRIVDWYWPEGFMEGGQKLQGEKPTAGEAAEQHLRKIGEEVSRYLPTLRSLAGDARFGRFAARALERAEKALNLASTFSRGA